jgi:serine/threonine protein kinase, bacterial
MGSVRTVAVAGAVFAALGAATAAGSPAAVVRPEHPGALAVAPGGALYVADAARQEILMRLPDGRFRVIAGTGRAGFSGDGGPATDAELRDPSGMAVSPRGTLYFADQGNNRVRAVSPDGRITTVAGDGRFGWVKTGTRALGAHIGSPNDVTLGPGGLLYIAASDEILRLNTGGTLTRIAGNQRYEGVFGVGGPAMNASPDGPNGLAFNRAGDLFIAGFNTKALLMVDRLGMMRAPIGQIGFYPRGTGGIVTTSTGKVFAMQTQTIVTLTPTRMTTIYNFNGRRIAGIGGFLPNGLAASASGTIYTDTDEGNGWASGTAIVAISPNHTVSVLWKA